MVWVDNFKKWLRDRINGGTFITIDGASVKIPANWIITEVKGDGLNVWGILDGDIAYAEPIEKDGRIDMEVPEPIVVLDTEMSKTRQNIMKFCCYVSVDSRTMKLPEYRGNRFLGLDRVVWFDLCQRFARTLDNCRKEAAIVCACYASRYQYEIVPAESILGRIIYVIEDK